MLCVISALNVAITVSTRMVTRTLVDGFALLDPCDSDDVVDVKM